jgi:hypothetical protein
MPEPEVPTPPPPPVPEPQVAPTPPLPESRQCVDPADPRGQYGAVAVQKIDELTGQIVPNAWGAMNPRNGGYWCKDADVETWKVCSVQELNT